MPEEFGHRAARRLHGEQQAAVRAELAETTRQRIAQLQLTAQALVEGRFQAAGQQAPAGLFLGRGVVEGIEQQQRCFTAGHLQLPPDAPALPGRSRHRTWQAGQLRTQGQLTHAQALPTRLPPEA
ncbi:hypothetical protein D9M68_848290 [compost metagenome]